MRRAAATYRPSIPGLLALAAGPGAAAAHQDEQATLVLSVGLGAHATNGGLWEIPRQAVVVLDTVGRPTGVSPTARSSSAGAST